MEITPNYNLIPYPDHDYQLKPSVPENPIRRQNFAQEPIDGHNRFRQPRPHNYTIHLEVSNHAYGVGQSLAYPKIDPIGHLIDIYA